MRFAYSEQLSPPGLMLPTFFRSIHSLDALTIEGKIDTGADMTAIPLELKNRLKLKAYALRRCRGALASDFMTVSTFFLEYSFDGSELFELEVLATSCPTALLGRDILNGLVLTANRPQQFFDLKRPVK